MKKWLVVLVLALFLLVFAMPLTASADTFTPTANNSIQFTNNLTLDPVTLTITDLQVALTVAATAHANAMTANELNMLATVMSFLLVLMITFFAFWKGGFLYYLACPTDLVYGLVYASTQTVSSPAWVEGVIVAIIGLYCLFHVVAEEVVNAGKRRAKKG